MALAEAETRARFREIDDFERMQAEIAEARRLGEERAREAAERARMQREEEEQRWIEAERVRIALEKEHMAKAAKLSRDAASAASRRADRIARQAVHERVAMDYESEVAARLVAKRREEKQAARVKRVLNLTAGVRASRPVAAVSTATSLFLSPGAHDGANRSLGGAAGGGSIGAGGAQLFPSTSRTMEARDMDAYARRVRRVMDSVALLKARRSRKEVETRLQEMHQRNLEMLTGSFSGPNRRASSQMRQSPGHVDADDANSKAAELRQFRLASGATPKAIARLSRRAAPSPQQRSSPSPSPASPEGSAPASALMLSPNPVDIRLDTVVHSPLAPLHPDRERFYASTKFREEQARTSVISFPAHVDNRQWLSPSDPVHIRAEILTSQVLSRDGFRPARGEASPSSASKSHMDTNHHHDNDNRFSADRKDHRDSHDHRDSYDHRSHDHRSSHSHRDRVDVDKLVWMERTRIELINGRADDLEARKARINRLQEERDQWAEKLKQLQSLNH